MSKTVIKVENVSKRYRIGVREKADTFAEQFKNTLLYPINNLRRISRLKKFKDEEDESIFWALRDINFEVKEGEVLGIIGHNGAGKSTLLKILSKITEPTTGSIRLRGRVSSLLEVGTGFHPELTGRENVYMNGTILGMTKREIDAKFDEIVDFAGVEKYIDTPVKFYSSGMKVRLGFAVAAHLEPEILIIDEVLAVGDAEFQRKCLGKMESVAESGRTVLFVSHNMGSVKTLCTRGLLLKTGNITEQGNTDRVISAYLVGDNGLGNYRKFSESHHIPGLTINSIGIKASGKSFDEPMSMDDSLEVLIAYNYYQKIADRIDFTFQFKGEDGTFLFPTSTLHAKNDIVLLGERTIKLKIPEHFFNQGTFYLNFLIVVNTKKIVFSQIDLISFIINPQKRELGMWTGKSRGFIRPKFDWQCA